MTIDTKLIGNNLRKIRYSQQLTIKQVAEMLNVSARHWGIVERGRQLPSIESLVLFCQKFQVSLNEILTEKDDTALNQPAKIKPIMQLSPEQFINLSDIATVFLSNNTPVSDVIDTQMMGKRLKKARERKGLTLKELASQTGLIWSHIHGLEKGRNIPSLKTLAKITTALGTTPDVILAKNLPTSKTFLYEEFMEKFQQLSKPEQQIMAKIIAFQIDELESEK